MSLTVSYCSLIHNMHVMQLLIQPTTICMVLFVNFKQKLLAIISDVPYQEHGLSEIIASNVCSKLSGSTSTIHVQGVL